MKVYAMISQATRCVVFAVELKSLLGHEGTSSMDKNQITRYYSSNLNSSVARYASIALKLD